MISPAILILLALGLGLAGWLAARSRAWAFQRASKQRLHSLPGYHGWYVALWTVVPALLFAVVWSSIAPQLVIGSVLSDPAAAALPAFGMQRDNLLSEAMAPEQPCQSSDKALTQVDIDRGCTPVEPQLQQHDFSLPSADSTARRSPAR